jgi:mono/diheme cytochrome c family protein
MRTQGWIGLGIAGTMMVFGLALTGCEKKGETKDSEKHESGASEAAEHASAHGVGPVQSVAISGMDEALAMQGEKIFSGTCAACHKMDSRYVGPALAGVTKRRAPEWIMNMIRTPTGMTAQDPTAKALLGEYMTQMSVNVTEADARAVLEFFRKHDGI